MSRQSPPDRLPDIAQIGAIALAPATEGIEPFRVTVPQGALNDLKRRLAMAATIFPHDYYRPPRAWAEALWPNLFYWNEVHRGGHFAAWEQPALFTDEVRKALRSIRGSWSN
jgi:hypothetical protein